MVVASMALMGRYLYWRYTATLPSPEDLLDWIAGATFIAIETLALLAGGLSLFFLGGVRDRSAESDAHRGWVAEQPRPPLVDVFICTYNEEERLVERTIVAALA